MANKHEILYSKARRFLNLRQVKHPWFNLNPFLEKVDEPVDLDNFLPDSETRLQPSTLVICEDYAQDDPLEIIEMTKGEDFFEYLFSEKWSAGSSLRVTEGSLLDLLFTYIFLTEKRKKVVRHSTYAFADNRRPKGSCYKMHGSSPSDFIEETLLLVFTYFGRLTKDDPNPCTITEPLAYLHLAPPPADDIPKIASDKEFESQVTTHVGLVKVEQGKLIAGGNSDSLESISDGRELRAEDLANFNPGFKYTRRGSEAEPLDVIQALQAFRGTNGRRLSMASTDGPMVPWYRKIIDKRRASMQPGVLTAPRRRLYSMSNESDLDALHNKWTKFQTTGALDSDDSAEMETSESEMGEDVGSRRKPRDDKYFGAELHLQRSSPCFEPGETVLKKLQRRKLELEESREVRASELQQFEAKQRLVKTEPLRSIGDYVDDEIHAISTALAINMPDKLPSFEQFLRILREDEMNDPRFRNKFRMKSKKLAKSLGRSLLAPPSSNIKTSLVSNSRTSLNSMYFRSNKVKRGGNQSKASDVIDSRRRARGPLRSPGSRDRMVNGTRGSGTGKDHFTKRAASKFSLRERTPAKTSTDQVATPRQFVPQTLPDITVVSPSGDIEMLFNGSALLKEEPEEVSVSTGSQEPPVATAEQPPVVPVTAKRSAVSTQVKLAKQATSAVRFPTVSLCDTPDSSADSNEEDNDTNESFDSSKLNTSYSFDRLRVKRRKMKKKPKFFDVLKKYYRLKAALKAFRKKDEVTKSSVQLNIPAIKPKKINRKPPVGEKPQPKAETELGVLRSFKFLESKDKKRINVDRLMKVHFSKQPARGYQEKILQAIDKFVVRREIVVSDKTSKGSSSLTFTRKLTLSN